MTGGQKSLIVALWIVALAVIAWLKIVMWS
jgi:hypothetical protein